MANGVDPTLVDENIDPLVDQVDTTVEDSEEDKPTKFDVVLQSPELKTASFDKSLGQENPMLDKLPVSPYAKEGGFGTPGFGFDVMYEMDEEEDREERKEKIREYNAPKAYYFENDNGKARSDFELLGNIGENFKDLNGQNSPVVFNFDGKTVNKIPETVDEYIAWRNQKTNSKVTVKPMTKDQEDRYMDYGDLVALSEMDPEIDLEPAIIKMDSGTKRYIDTSEDPLSMFNGRVVKGKGLETHGFEVPQDWQNHVDAQIYEGGIVRFAQENIEWDESANNGEGHYVFKNVMKREQTIGLGAYSTQISYTSKLDLPPGARESDYSDGALVTREKIEAASYFGTENVQAHPFLNPSKITKDGSLIDYSKKLTLMDYGDGTTFNGVPITEEDYENYEVMNADRHRENLIKYNQKRIHSKDLKKKSDKEIINDLYTNGIPLLSEKEQEYVLLSEKLRNQKETHRSIEDLTRQSILKEELKIREELYDYTTGKTYNIKNKDIPVHVLDFHRRAKEKSKEFSVNDLNEKLVDSKYKLQSIADIITKYVKKHGKDQIAMHRRILEDVANITMSEGMDSELDQDLAIIKKLSKTGVIPKDISNIAGLGLTDQSGAHPLVEKFNKALGEYALLNEALLLNSDPFTKEKEGIIDSYMAATPKSLGFGTAQTGVAKQTERAEVLNNLLGELGAEYFGETEVKKTFLGIPYGREKINSGSYHAEENMRQLIGGTFADFQVFMYSIALFNKWSGNGFKKTADGVKKIFQRAPIFESALPIAQRSFTARWANRVLNFGAGVAVEGGTFAAAGQVFEPLMMHDSNPYDNFMSGAYLYTGGALFRGLMSKLPMHHIPGFVRAAKSDSFMAWQRGAGGAFGGSVAFHSAGVMEGLAAGQEWDEAIHGLTAKSFWGEYIKLRMFGAKNTILGRNGVIRGLENDYLHFRGQTKGSKDGAKYFGIDHKDIVENGKEKAFERAVNKKRKQIEKDKSLSNEQVLKELKELGRHKVNVENALYRNLGKIQVNRERGYEKDGKTRLKDKKGNPLPINDRTPSDTDIYLLTEKLKRGEELSLKDNETLANTPEGILFARLGIKPGTKSGNRVLESVSNSRLIEDILDYTDFKTPRGSKERESAYNFLMESSVIQSQIKNLKESIKTNKERGIDTTRLEENLKQREKELEDYKGKLVDGKPTGGEKYIELQKLISKKYETAYEQKIAEAKQRQEVLGGKFEESISKEDFQKRFEELDPRDLDVKDRVAFQIGNIRVVNKEKALETRNLEFGIHEDAHFIVKDAVRGVDGKVSKKGITLINGLLNQLTPNQRKDVETEMLRRYGEEMKGPKENWYEEYITIFSELVSKGKIAFSDNISKSLLDFVPFIRKQGFENVEMNAKTGRNLFELIRKLPTNEVKVLESAKKIIKEEKLDEKATFSKERAPEDKLQDAKIKDLLIKYKEGAKSPEIIKEIESKEKTLDNLKERGYKDDSKGVIAIKKEIKSLKELDVNASILPELKKETAGLLTKYKSMFKPELGGDVFNARVAIENTLEKLYDTYKPFIKDKSGKIIPNPVEFIGYADNLMRKRMPAIFEKYGFKEIPKDLLPEEGKPKEEAIARKINPVDLVRDPDINIINEVQSNMPTNLEGKSFANLGNLAVNSTAKLFGIPKAKLLDPAKNLTQGEARNIQDAIVRFGSKDVLKLMPEQNIVPLTAREGIKGTSLGIPKSLLKPPLYIQKDARSKGRKSQTKIFELNKELTDVQFLKALGVIKGENNITNDRTINQRLKGIANFYGRLMTNTTVRKLKFKDEGIVNVLNDIALGKSKAMFSKEQDLKEANDIKNKYKLNESQFIKSFETILDNGKLKNKELQQDLEQLSVNVSKTEFYAEKARNKNFKKKFQEERLNTDFDKNFAEKLGVSSKEATKLLNELQDSNASFFNSEGKLDDKNGYKKFSKQWGDFYNFWGEMGSELGTRRKGTNLTKFFEQITWVGERTTGKGKDFDLIGDSGKNKQTIQFNIDKSKKSLRNVIENHKDLNEAQKKDLLEQFDNIDFTKIDPAVIAKQDRWRKLIEQEAPESKKIKDLQKEIPQGHVENMGNIFNLLKTMERYWFESKEGSGKLDAARFLYQTSRMNSNLVFGQRSTFGNKYFYITEGFQGMGMKNPVYAEAYNEAVQVAKKDPNVLNVIRNRKLVTISAQEYAEMKAKDAAKLKGEHATDSATVQLKTWIDTVTGKGKQGIGTLNLNDLIQVASPKKYLDIIDKALGTNAEGGILRFIADSRVRSELSKFKKPFGGDLLQDIITLSKKLLKENPAFSDHILNDKFLNSSSTSTTLKAKTRNKKQTVINYKNMVKIGDAAGVNIKNVTISQIFNKINNLDKAKTVKFSKDKGMTTLDFDYTVGISKSKVRYTLPNGKTGKLNASQFAMRSESLEAKGAKFDFSEFTKVIDGKKGPLFDKLQKAVSKFGNENVFILTARPQASAVAIHAFLKEMGVNLRLENIVGLENGTAKAKSDWIIDKIGNDKYNDIYFADDAPKNVKAVQKVIDNLNLKGRSVEARFSKERDLNKEVNAMIEYSKGIGKEKTYTATKGRLAGRDKKGTGFYLPSRAEDFMGLVRPFFGKGKQGIQNEKWWNDNFTRVFSKATKEFQTDQRTRMSDYRALRRELKENVLEERGQNTFVERNKFWKHPLKEKISNEKTEVYTNEHAARVYNWAKEGVTAQELNISKKDFNKLINHVENNAALKSFADQLVVINKGDGYPKPTELWATRGINFDMRTSAASVKREKYFKDFNENVNVVFSEKNLNKMEAALGNPWRKSIENMLFRMKTGSNRPSWARGDKWESNALDWLNLSVNDVMFLNTRSALLQQVSMGNYVNYSDNNIFKASARFTDQMQFWKDYTTLMNSEWALNRREGLKFNIQESEIIDAASNTKNRSVAALQLALSKGFVMTKYADSHATAFGGAAFYRNRINTYTKKGFSEKEAKKKAMEDWMELSDQNQQSARADKISNEQAGLIGRFTLNFNNVTLQYGRLAKKDVMDLANGRVDGLLKGNNSVAAKMARISYYMGMQNAIFYGLQNAMFVTFFDDDIGESLMDTKQERVVNGMLDNILIGSGVYGKIAATIKNFGYKLYKESGKDRPKYSDAAWELTKVSPPVDIKLRKFRSALKTLEYDMDEIKTKGFSLDNPALSVTAKMIEGSTNAPTDRILRKMLNVESALEEDREAWQRIFLFSGFADYDLGIEDETSNYNPKIKKKNKKFKSSKFKKIKNKKFK